MAPSLTSCFGWFRLTNVAVFCLGGGLVRLGVSGCVVVLWFELVVFGCFLGFLGVF
jgi:hypothetical protein